MALTKVTSDIILDGTIANVDLASDIAVTGGQIADNAVTLAKMAGGTDGNLITYDASGDPAYVTTGVATNVLTSNGPDTAPTFQATSSAGFIKYTVYTGNHTWLKSANSPTKVVVELVGGGGSSGSSDNAYWNGGGGGSAGYARKYIDVSSVTEADIVVGAGGVKNEGTSAGNSSWDDTGDGGSSTITGNGGGNGVNGAGSNGAGGAAGAASGGDLNMPGGNGGAGGADSGPNKVQQSSAFSAGGFGHLISHPSYGAGFAGLAYGGGASAGRGAGVAVDGADGAAGVVIVWEYA